MYFNFTSHLIRFRIYPTLVYPSVFYQDQKISRVESYIFPSTGSKNRQAQIDYKIYFTDTKRHGFNSTSVNRNQNLS